METLISDIRYGFRLLLHKPGTTVVAALTHALGIGATTAVFSVVKAYSFGRFLITHLTSSSWSGRTTRGSMGPQPNGRRRTNFFDWREQNEVFERMFAHGGWGPTLSGANEPEQLSGVVASHDAFIILGIEPLLGRGFRAEEDAANT